MTTITIDDARGAKDLVRQRFADIPGVRVMGVGLTRSGSGYAVKINLDRAAPPGLAPSVMHGVPIVVEVVGTISSD